MALKVGKTCFSSSGNCLVTSLTTITQTILPPIACCTLILLSILRNISCQTTKVCVNDVLCQKGAGRELHTFVPVHGPLHRTLLQCGHI